VGGDSQPPAARPSAPPARGARTRWPLRLFVAAVAAAGAGVLAHTAPLLPADRAADVAVLFVLCALAQRMPVPLLRNSSMSVAFAVGVAALVAFGPAAAVWVQLGAGLMMAVVPHRKPPIKVLYNLGAVPLQQAATGLVYAALGGAVGAGRLDWALLPPAVAAIAVFVLANTLMLSAVIALETGAGLRNVFDANYRWLLPNYVGVGLIGLGMGVAVQAVGLPGVAIFLIPLAMAWYSYKLYTATTEEVRRRNEELRLTNARLDVANSRLHQRITELATLNKVGLSLNNSLDLGNVLGDVLAATLQVVPGTGALVALVDSATGHLSIASSVGLSTKAAMALQDAGGPLSRSLSRPDGLSLLDTEAVGSDQLAEAGIAAVHCLPLRLKGEVGGVFAVVFGAAQDLGADQRVLLATLAEQAAAAVHNARLYQQIEQGYLATIQAVVSVVDARERYARGHSERVRALCAAAAAELGLDAQTTATLELAAVFHDIGHVGVPEAVLNKPGGLSAEEWATVRQHPLLGAAMLEQVPRMEGVAHVIRQHHERYDGLGYPAGLLGNEIHTAAQVLAVADAYEAMTSPRPHRPALPRVEAVAELRKNAGTQFAPGVVEAFVRATGQPVAARTHAAPSLLRRLQAEAV
jgi:hypothetical protein